MVDALDAYFREQLSISTHTAAVGPDHSGTESGQQVDRLRRLFTAQAQSRHLDFAARWLQKHGDGFYTIGSAGHESNAAVGLVSRVTDPALLHYRSGGFYAARAQVDGTTDGIQDVLRTLSCSASDPISGGRHKVFGHPTLHIVPQTSTIASHLPRAVGLAFALGLAGKSEHETPWPDDAVVICSFGDASANHSTAVGAFNAAAYLTHRRRECPVLFVCEDNGIGISTRSPRGWPGAALSTLPGIDYLGADGTDPVGALTAAESALDVVRTRRQPAVLHLRTVRFLGHAGSDVESAYRSRRAIEADYARDPLLATARALVARGVSPTRLLDEYDDMGAKVAAAAEQVRHEARLEGRAAVTAPLAYPSGAAPQPVEAPPAEEPNRTPPGTPINLSQAINKTLMTEMAEDPAVLLFGEDVAAKGGVYGVTRGLLTAHGGDRVFDTLLDEQTVLGTALGAALAGYLPVPEIQYLAYLHNAEDQLRGEAASLRFFSNGSYDNGMVVRIAGLAYQRGFGGHFHNDNSISVLRDIPGIVVAVPSHPATAPGLLRGCLELARAGRVCVYLEPIARYHSRDLLDGDGAWLAPWDDAGSARLGEVTTYAAADGGRDLLMITFGNGVHLSRRVAATLADEGTSTTVLDLQWLHPLPFEAFVSAAAEHRAVLVVDETRETGGVAAEIMAALVENGQSGPIGRVASADSFIPLGPAAATVLLQEEEILSAARRLSRDGAAESVPRHSAGHVRR